MFRRKAFFLQINWTLIETLIETLIFSTTDFRDIRDIDHERKRDNPFDLCNLCSEIIAFNLFFARLIKQSNSSDSR